MKFKSVILCILDGWGIGINNRYNAIINANPPCWNYINNFYPKCTLSASGIEVGLPNGQIGSSEVGHMNIGSGRVTIQNLERISREIISIDKNKNLQDFIYIIKKKYGICHIMGLLSDGGVHSHQEHILILANKISKFGIKVVIHAFLDGRDRSPNSGKNYIQKFEDSIKNNSNIKIATISGRYYAMDRDNRWERTNEAYKAIAFASANSCNNAVSLIEKNYINNISDEFIKPTIIGNYQGIKPEDGILLANFRADRMLQLTNILIGKSNFIEVAKFSSILSMTQYKADLNIPYLFPSKSFINTLGQVISDNRLRQLRVAETEKYAHVTFFFNCGKEKPFFGEERILIPSPKVRFYDLRPEMSAFEITEKLIEKIFSKKFSLIIVNYANADMIGHTGNMKAACDAILVIDNCIMKILNTIRKIGDIALIITSDHGNIECMFDEKNNIAHTSHTLNKVPFIICSNKSNNLKLKNNGNLSNIAPTILKLLGIKKPKEMTTSLI